MATEMCPAHIEPHFPSLKGGPKTPRVLVVSPNTFSELLKSAKTICLDLQDIQFFGPLVVSLKDTANEQHEMAGKNVNICKCGNNGTWASN